MKKIISILLSTVIIIATAVFSANASTAGDNNGVNSHNNFSVLEQTTLEDNQVRLYAYNFTDNNPKTGIRFVDTELNTSQECYFNGLTTYKQISMPVDTTFKNWTILEGTSDGCSPVRYDKTGGKYEKIRIKLSDFSDYFNADGTHTQKGFNYNFSTQKNGENTYYSSLIFVSGGIYTAVTPDKDGYAEFYVSKAIGAEIWFDTSFVCRSGNKTDSSGGGEEFRNLKMGDVNLRGTVNVDDVTKVQSYSAGTEELDSLQRRNADVTGDGKIDVDDATMIQKHLAGYDV